MEIKKFGLGIRFDLLETYPNEQVEKMLFEEIFSVLTVNDVKGMRLYGGINESDKNNGRNIYHVVFSGGGFKDTKRIYEKLDNDAGIGMYLAHSHPFIETNRLQYVTGLTYFGTVRRDGKLSGGDRGFFSLSVPKKHGKRRPLGKGMSIIMAMTSFSYSINETDAIRRLTIAARRYFPGTKIVPLPIVRDRAGVMEAMVTNTDGEVRTTRVRDVLGAPIEASFGVIKGSTAIIELASAGRDSHIASHKRDVLSYSSFGVGELIKRALDEGLLEIMISGGSQRLGDCGMGCAEALGAKFFDINGNLLEANARNLVKISHMDISNMDTRVNKARFVAMADGQKRLTGIHGVAAMNSQRYRLSAQDTALLECGIRNFKRVLSATFDCDEAKLDNSGALEGFAAFALAMLSAQVRDCADAFLDAVDFKTMLKTAALVVTGGSEREMDTITKVVECANKGKTPVASILDASLPLQLDAGVMPVFDMDNFDLSADKLFSLIRVGRDVHKKPLPKKLVRRL